MKIYISTLTLLLGWAFWGSAQEEYTFWNPEMEQLAEPWSSEGWIRIRSDHEEAQSWTADNFFDHHRQAFGLSQDNAMILQKTIDDELGMRHYRFQQQYKDLRVEGSEFILHEVNGKILSANGKITPHLDMDVIPTLDEESAFELVLQAFPADGYGWEVLKNDQGEYHSEYPIGDLILCYTGTGGLHRKNDYRLAYRFEIIAVEPLFDQRIIYVDANTGEIVKNQSEIKDCNCCSGTCNTIHYGQRTITSQKQPYPGTKYELIDNCRGGGIRTEDNGFLAESNSPGFNLSYNERMAGSAHWAAGMSHDYFLNTFGRQGFDGQNGLLNVISGIIVIADKANFTSPNTLKFGTSGSLTHSPPVALDIVGHEFAHGVVFHSAKLSNTHESDALNESFADIFGTLIEFYVQGGNGDYLLAEDVWIQDGKLRDMSAPNSKGHPDTYQGTFWSNGTDIHADGGVQNYWFYLLSNGGSGTNDMGTPFAVNGIGRDKTAQIVYRSLTLYLTSTAQFKDAAVGAIWAAMDLYGSCSNEVTQTINAWNAVGVSTHLTMAYDMVINCQQLNQQHNAGHFYAERITHNMEVSCDISPAQTAGVLFAAGNQILLLPGFRSETNTLAEIAPCLPFLQPPPGDDGGGSTASKNSITSFHESEMNAESMGIEVFPNPSTGLFSIHLPEHTPSRIQVLDQAGKLVREKQLQTNQGELDLSGYPDGLYLLLINTSDQVYNQRVLINSKNAH